MTGVPGGLDYLLLVFEGEGLMKRSTYKGISASINNWFRGPLGVISGYICLLGLWHQWEAPALTTYQITTFVGLGIHALWNPPFFGRQAIEANIVDTINRFEMVGKVHKGISLGQVRSKSGLEPKKKD